MTAEGRKCRPGLEGRLARVERERPTEPSQGGRHHAARGSRACGHRMPRRDGTPLERGAAPLRMALEVSLDHAPDVVVAALEARGDRVPVLAVVRRNRWIGPDAGMLERS